MMNRRNVVALLLSVWLSACSVQNADEHADEAQEAPEGPHGGRLLEGDAFDLELSILESGVEPVYRAYLYDEGRELPPDGASVTIELTRFTGTVDVFELRPEGQYLTAPEIVYEPHSFVIRVQARVGDERQQWEYESFEGRTQIEAAFAERAGIRSAPAAAAVIDEVLTLNGTLELAPAATAQVRARFPGIVMSLAANVGDAVRRGQPLATVESNESLTRYTVSAPISGVIARRSANVGETVSDQSLFEIADPTRLEAHLQVFPGDLGLVRVGLPVTVRVAGASVGVDSRLAATAPLASDRSQTIVVRAPVVDESGLLRAGLAVTGEVEIAATQVPVAVRIGALQRWRDMDVVFRAVGDTYEVQPVVLGLRDATHAQVLEGLAAGDIHVTENSYLVKADIEKSGASHDH